ncbi:MAG: toxin [Gammaproteobacteria bacterium]|nr:toxin [Gammaproteobacteria bacterium]NKB64909.1 toxin [Gammaproteobacteria bacterium]
MKKYPFDWDTEKNTLLKETRGVCFEDIAFALNNGAWSVDEPHPNQEQYPHQRVLTVLIDDYAIVVPYVIDEERKVLFLKTLFPSRKLTKFHFSQHYDRKEN